MLEFSILKIVWWMIVGVILMVYASTAGFDLGVTLIMPFLRKEVDRRVALNASAPTWDGNQTWIVFAGGALFVVWPLVYSTAFSGMYFAMFAIVWGFFLRPPGYDYRSKIDSALWRRFWDWGLFTSSLIPVFIFGLAFGNCFHGYPFYFDTITMRSFYVGGFGSLLNPIGIYCGIMALLMTIMHGFAYLARRTENPLRQTARVGHVISTLLTLAMFITAGFFVAHMPGYILESSPVDPRNVPFDNVVSIKNGAWLESLNVYEWKRFAPGMMIVGALLSLWANYFRWYATCFWGSAMCVSGIIATAGATLFPFLMPSSIKPNQSITVWNGVSTQYALNTMLYVGIVILLIILAYKIFAYWSVWHDKKTVSREDVAENEHTFY